MDVIAASAKVKAEDILAHDLYLYSRVPGTIWGEEREFVSSPKLDDLQCAFAAFRGFTLGKKEEAISVYALFDNEEVGSQTAQGAGSTFLYNVLMRLASSLGLSYDETMAAISRSFMISADNAHAVHPNHPEYADPVTRHQRRYRRQVQRPPELCYQCILRRLLQKSLRRESYPDADLHEQE